MKNKVLYLSIAAVLLSVLNYGTDLTLHLHNSWLYYTMMRTHHVMLKDPYLLGGEQITFIYGSIAYIVSGLLYGWLGAYTIDILSLMLAFLDIFYIIKLMKNDKASMIATILSISVFTLADSYVALFSLTLFWHSLYMFKKGKGWKVPLILACVNHPVTIVPALYFVLKDRKNLAIISSIAAYFIAIIIMISSNTHIGYPYIMMTLARIAIMVSPIIIDDKFIYDISSELKSIIKENRKVIKNELGIETNKVTRIINKIAYNKKNIMIILNLIIVTCFATLIVTQENISHSYNNINLLARDIAYGFPKNISSKIRVIDYFNLPSVYAFPKDNITLGDGSFRENNPTGICATIANSLDEYKNITSNYDYVLICRYCTTPTNDRYFLDRYYTLVWENEYYQLFNLSQPKR